MSKVHEHLSPESYGIPLLPIFDEICQHATIVKCEKYYGLGENQYTDYYYCEDCEEEIDPEDYRGEE